MNVLQSRSASESVACRSRAAHSQRNTGLDLIYQTSDPLIAEVLRDLYARLHHTQKRQGNEPRVIANVMEQLK